MFRTIDLKKLYKTILFYMVLVAPFLTLGSNGMELGHRYSRIVIFSCALIGLFLLSSSEIKAHWPRARRLIAPFLPWILGVTIASFCHGRLAGVGLEHFWFPFLLVFVLMMNLAEMSFSRVPVLIVFSISNLIFASYIIMAYMTGSLGESVLAINKNILAPGIVLISVVLFVEALKHTRETMLCVFLCLGFICGLVCISLLQVRTALVGLFALFFIPLCEKKKIDMKLSILFFVLFSLVLFYFFYSGRLGQGLEDLVSYAKGRVNTSWGIRLELWRCAISGCFSQPLLGWGSAPLGQIIDNADCITALADFWSGASHFHNDFFHILANYGLFGLSCWGLMLFLLFQDAGRDLSRKVLVLGLILIGLSESSWSHGKHVSVVFYLLWFLLLVTWKDPLVSKD